MGKDEEELDRIRSSIEADNRRYDQAKKLGSPRPNAETTVAEVRRHLDFLESQMDRLMDDEMLELEDCVALIFGSLKLAVARSILCQEAERTKQKKRAKRKHKGEQL